MSMWCSRQTVLVIIQATSPQFQAQPEQLALTARPGQPVPTEMMEQLGLQELLVLMVQTALPALQATTVLKATRELQARPGARGPTVHRAQPGQRVRQERLETTELKVR